jgi:hypothetical protein
MTSAAAQILMTVVIITMTLNNLLDPTSVNRDGAVIASRRPTAGATTAAKTKRHGRSVTEIIKS